MKVELGRQDWQAALRITNTVAERKFGMDPIVGHVLVRADEEGLHLASPLNGAQVQLTLRAAPQVAATTAEGDSEATEPRALGASLVVHSPGATTLPAHSLARIVGFTAPTTVLLLTAGEDGVPDGKARISFDRASFKLNALAATDFTVAPQLNGGEALAVKSGILAQALQRVHHAAARADARTQLNGVLLHVVGTALHVVATDGHRLALEVCQPEWVTSAPADLERSAFRSRRVILPDTALGCITAALAAAGPDATVELRSDGRVVELGVGRFAIHAQTCGQGYPDYEPLITAQPPHVAMVDRAGLLGAVRRIGLVADEVQKEVRFEFQENALTLHAQQKDAEGGDEQLDVTCASGGQVSFNYHYVLEALGALADEKIKLRTGGGADAMQMLRKDQLLPYQLIMPLRATHA